MKIADIPKISRLSTAEKILFVEDVWDSIASKEHIPMPESHKAELDRRSVKYQNHGGRLLSLKELQARKIKRKIKSQALNVEFILTTLFSKYNTAVVLHYRLHSEGCFYRITSRGDDCNWVNFKFQGLTPMMCDPYDVFTWLIYWQFIGKLPAI